MKLHTFLPDLCLNCSLAANRTTVVADEEGDNYRACEPFVMVIGEAPGYNEDKQGRPFVGRSGEYLERLLVVTGLKRSDVYLTNVVRCRPPGNAKPKPAQVAEHRAALEAAIEYAHPTVICAMGDTALAWFGGQHLTANHGKPFVWQASYGEVRVVPLFHPAYAMRKPAVWPLLVAAFEHLLDDVPVPAPTRYTLADADGLEAVLRTLSPGTQIGFDIETTDVTRAGVFYPHEQHIMGYSVAFGEGDAVFVMGEPTEALKAVLERDDVVKVCHNAKFEWQVLQNYGIELRAYEDTKVAAYLLQYQSSRLKDLSRQVLGVEQVRLEDVTKGRPTSEVSAEEWCEYGAADADLTLRLWKVLWQRLKDEGLIGLYYEFELPLIPVLARAERRGVRVDAAELHTVADGLKGRLAELEVTLQEWLPNVNLRSDNQVREVLFSEKAAHFVSAGDLKTRSHIRLVPKGLGLRSVGKTDSGLPKLDKAALGELEGVHPCVKVLREYRQTADYLGDFVEKIPTLLDELGTLHTSINQAGTWEDQGVERESPATGRLSSSGPNLMQIPSRTEVGRLVKRAFKARDGYVWVSMDVQQEEPRLLALAADETAMKVAFANGSDIYWPIAELLKQVLTHDPKARLSKDERDKWGLKYRDTAKTIFLGIQYGAQQHKIASVHPGLDMRTAGVILEGFHRTYPGIRRYIRAQQQLVWEKGYAVTLFGRKRWLPGIWVRETYNEALRQACNHPIQGTGADVLKGTLIRLFGEGGSLVGKAEFMFPVHDSVEMEVKENDVQEVLAVLSQATAWFTAIELPVEVKVGRNWAEMEVVHA